MNQIEQLHKENIENCFDWINWSESDDISKEAASKSAEITEQIAIEFAQFIEGAYSFGNITGKWYLHMNTDKEYTAKELFQEFLKTKQ